MRMRWTNTARNDLRAIKAYIARDSLRYANRVVQRIRGAIAVLKTFPEMGARLEEWSRLNAREIVVGNYRVIYCIKAKRIWIVTIIHAARLLPDEPEL